MREARKGTFLICSFVAAAVLCLAAPAFAQEPAPTPPPTESAPPPATHHHAVGGAPGAGGLGVGAAAFVSGLAGPEVVYDFGIWHLGGMLAFDHRQVGGGMAPPDQTTFLFSVSAWYHLHMGDASDFSLGGGFGLINQSVNMGGPSNTAFEFEPGAQVRVFVTSNVAVSARLGVVFAFGDDIDPLHQQIGLNGQTLAGVSTSIPGGLTGGFGFTYFFR